MSVRIDHDLTTELELGPRPRRSLGALHVLSVRARDRPLVAMDLAQFAAMSPRWRDACRAALADSALLLIHARPNAIGKYGERAAIVCDGDALRGWLPVEVGAGEESLLAFHGHITRALAARAPERTEEPDDDDDD